MKTQLFFAVLTALAIVHGLTALPLREDTHVNVWVVAHSHDDVGWLMTIDDYFVFEVQYILDNVVTELLANPKRKYIQVEVAFFERWWHQQTDTRKAEVKRLVDSGQFEFILGGMCMHDEATTHYDGIINQLSLGHKFLMDTFGVVPKVGWHIDPFGASSSLPWLYHDIGFEGHIINRIDYRLKNSFMQNKSMEFNWRGARSHGDKKDMFTHVMDNHYCTPEGFSWEHGVTQNLPHGDGDAPIIIKPPSQMTQPNVEQRAAQFLQMARTRAAYYKTANILIPFGCDFTYQNARMVFKNLDLLMDYINENSERLNAKVQYSTLSDYMAAVKRDGANWPLWQQDFFPYADNSASYWTGYFTSLPALKGYGRVSESVLHNAEMMMQMAIIERSLDEDAQSSKLSLLRDATAVLQHHDGITGTERKVVAEDYTNRLSIGLGKAKEVAADMIALLVTKSGSVVPNMTSSAEKIKSNLAAGLITPVVLFSSLGSPRKTYVKIPVPVQQLRVEDAQGNMVASQTNPAFNGTEYTLFFAADIPPVGFSTYYIMSGNSNSLGQAKDVLSDDETIQNSFYRITVSGLNKALSSIHLLRSRKTLEITQKFFTYASANYQPSGAYIFHPNGPAALLTTSAPQITLIQGPLVSEVVFTWSSLNIKQAIRLYEGLSRPFIENEGAVGPIQTGQEIVSRFLTNISSGSKLHTDSNGLENQERINNPNGRPGDYDHGAQIGGNFYPSTSRAFIKDTEMQFTVLVDRSIAVASLESGSIEFMVHRRCQMDDYRGVGEPLNDATSVLTRGNTHSFSRLENMF
eukprot:TRINITY_DN2949_c0_g1_i3.p1 TRINITY_DN2949_c0_g1~~TRINITY_DN2949_c0_g1_i3.p1  ORF type:complete len:804 (+),score=157.64 TRINITY_DN2949_c0_g1_i3:64-2475(+)